MEEKNDGQSRARVFVLWENPVGEGEYCRRIVRMRIRFRRKCSDIPRNLFASGGISVVFGNAGGCVIFDSREEMMIKRHHQEASILFASMRL